MHASRGLVIVPVPGGDAGPNKEHGMTRIDIQNEIARTLKAQTGRDIEVTLGASVARGSFVSLCATIDALDAARDVMQQVANVTFSDRDIDPEDDEQVDFYAFA